MRKQMVAALAVAGLGMGTGVVCADTSAAVEVDNGSTTVGLQSFMDLSLIHI